MRFSQRDKALLISAGIHGVMVLALGLYGLYSMRSPLPLPQGQGLVRLEDPAARVWLPPREVLRQLLPPPVSRPARRPEPPRQRISIGAPSQERAKELILRREDDLTAVPKGRPGAMGAPAEAPSQEPTPSQAVGGSGPQAMPMVAPRSKAATALPAVGSRPQGRVPSIAESVRRWGARVPVGEGLGVATGTGRQMGPLFFDPAGADFTAWVNQFKNEVYRNWIAPQSVFLGVGGRVDLQFVADRSGRLIDLRLLQSSGTGALDRAAENALTSSRFLPLPPDYGPSEVAMRITFIYGAGAGS